MLDGVQDFRARAQEDIMFSKLFWAMVFVELALHSAVAQDPTKVEPRHYKLAFENESVQVLDVHYGPHEKSGMHDHPGGVVVVLTAGHLRFTDENGKTREVFAKPGESRWFPAFKHKVENLGATSYSAVYIGIKAKPVAAKAAQEGGQTALGAQTARLLADQVVASTGW
jgi:quercetin dioxygenase-like cupin family protein